METSSVGIVTWKNGKIVRTTKKKLRKAPTVEVSQNLIDLLRQELRHTMSESRRLKLDLRNIEKRLKLNKGKTSELYRLVATMEKTLKEDTKV